AGILWLAVPAGQIPWVALLLAVSFGLYGLIRKIAPVSALVGMVWETLVMLPFSLAYLGFAMQNGSLVFGELDTLQQAVLIGSGVATVVPLLCFAAGARRIPLSVMGMIQYFSPTVQMLLGLLLFGERFSLNNLIGYILVWCGVVLYLAALRYRKKA
ncbi:MAG: EamA family transporter, partial [Neisseria sp.]|nr:EamA family transporter [Neisseria sp.]